MITPDQAVAARRLLGWSLMKLSSCSGVSDVSIERFEKGKVASHGFRANIDAIQRALEGGGIEFSRQQPSVRLREGNHGR
jgi:transcriptional regulator with XRE-family HTH domain